MLVYRVLQPPGRRIGCQHESGMSCCCFYWHLHKDILLQHMQPADLVLKAVGPSEYSTNTSSWSDTASLSTKSTSSTLPSLLSTVCGTYLPSASPAESYNSHTTHREEYAWDAVNCGSQ
jgi:hypothetical protein